MSFLEHVIAYLHNNRERFLSCIKEGKEMELGEEGEEEDDEKGEYA